MVDKKVKIEPISQEDPFGCGVACTAFIIGKSYQETKKLFDVEKVESYGCDCPDIAKVLKSSGYKYGWGKYSGQDIPDGSVVYLGRSDYYKVGHWLVKAGDKWMDPWQTGKTYKEARAGFSDKLLGTIEWFVYPIIIKEGN